MKGMKWAFVALSLVLLLTACGQGNANEQNNNVEETAINETTGANKNDNTGNNEEEMTENNEQNDSINSEGNIMEDGNTEEENKQQENDTTTINNVQLYFADNELMGTFRVDTNVSVTFDEDGAKKAYELWLNGPEDERLVNLLPQNTEVQSVQFKDGVAHVSFSEDILEANLGSTGELMVTEQIALIASQFGFDKTQILIDGEVTESFLGHMTISEPIDAPNPNDYETLN